MNENETYNDKRMLPQNHLIFDEREMTSNHRISQQTCLS